MNQDFYCEEILSKKTSVEILRETENVLAFMHTRPTWEFHAVVIPRVHIKKLVDLEDMTIVKEVFDIMKDIIVEKGFASSNYKIITNGGSYQSTQHLHFHLVSGRPLDVDNPAQKGELGV